MAATKNSCIAEQKEEWCGVSSTTDNLVITHSCCSRQLIAASAHPQQPAAAAPYLPTQCYNISACI